MKAIIYKMSKKNVSQKDTPDKRYSQSITLYEPMKI